MRNGQRSAMAEAIAQDLLNYVIRRRIYIRRCLVDN